MSIRAPAGLMSRPAQLAPLPYKDFDILLRLPIEAAIVTAWSHVLALEALDLATATEVTFTRHLVDTLNTMLNAEVAEVDGFSASIFETIDRGCELCSYDNTHVEKKPDMVVRLAGKRPGISHRAYYGLFVECKIADKNHTMTSYCGDGLIRFVQGQYAWAMGSAIMIGYARHGYILPTQLHTHISELGSRYHTLGGPVLRSDIPPHAGDVYLTRHHRPWVYPSGGSPGTIEIAHIWLPAERAPAKQEQDRSAVPQPPGEHLQETPSGSSPTLCG
jgi:hypothetical protein